MFYRPVASKMNALLGRKAAAYSNISILLMTRATPNTFYNEGSPLWESPLAKIVLTVKYQIHSCQRQALIMRLTAALLRPNCSGCGQHKRQSSASKRHSAG